MVIPAVEYYEKENDVWRRFLVTGEVSDRIIDVARQSEKWNGRLGNISPKI